MIYALLLRNALRTRLSCRRVGVNRILSSSAMSDNAFQEKEGRTQGYSGLA
jgi:hypothetical protein